MFATADVTPITQPVSAVYFADRGSGTPLREYSTEKESLIPREGETPLSAYASAAPYIIRVPGQVGESPNSEVHTGEPMLNAKQLAEREARIALLVRKFEGAGSIEDDARFKILTARMRRLEQTSDERVYRLLSDVVSDIEAVTENLDSIRAKFGL
jgi:hypothetical protein